MLNLYFKQHKPASIGQKWDTFSVERVTTSSIPTESSGFSQTTMEEITVYFCRKGSKILALSVDRPSPTHPRAWAAMDIFITIIGRFHLAERRMTFDFGSRGHLHNYSAF